MDFNTNWKKYLEELADPQFVDVESLKLKDTLPPEIWESGMLNPEISQALEKIVVEFFETLKLDSSVQIKDIILTGSLATYNWSDYSDVDLHILLDFNKLHNRVLLEDYFKEKTRNWNRTHNILIKGYEVELYIQDSNEPHHASGIWSINENRWIKQPSRHRREVDYDTVKKKAANFMEAVDHVYDDYAEKDYRQALLSAEKLMDRIKKYRRAGLSTGGIYSVENLVFKVLRRNDYIKKLSSLKILSYDKLMSVNGGY